MWLLRFTRQQPLYLMIAAGAAGIIWAVTGQAPSVTVTLIYSFLCGNFTLLVLENVRIPCSWRKASWSWLIYLILLLVITPVAVTVATFVVFISVSPALVPPAPRTSFGDFLLTAWKFPAVTNLIFGGACLSYLMTRCRLEDRNRQLQQVINSEACEREHDAAELQQAREIQEGLLPKELPRLTEFEVAGVWEPAKVVGGDYRDVIRLSKDKLAICIADVVGKGVSAGLLMANVQASVRAFAAETAFPCIRVQPDQFRALRKHRLWKIWDAVLWRPRCEQPNSAIHKRGASSPDLDRQQRKGEAPRKRRCAAGCLP